MYKKLILGPPGTGKTTRLLEIVDSKLAAGIPPERIAFVSFTKKAVQEALSRAAEKFNLPKRRFTHFKTLHSIAYRELGITPDKVLQREHLDELGAIVGLRLTGRSTMEDMFFKGDKLLFIEGYARSTKADLEATWKKGMFDLSWFELKRFADTYQAYKKERGLLDYTDMLELYAQQVIHLDIDIAIVDEAQDLSLLQWDIVTQAIHHAKELYIAGDDDQAIYKWSGADVQRFLSLDMTETEVLPISYRLPKNIHAIANRVSQRIKHRFEKHWQPKEAKGVVKYHNNIESVEFRGNWLVLVRTHHLISNIERSLRENGILFSSRNMSSVQEEHLTGIQSYVALQNGKTITGMQAMTLKKMAALHIAIDVKNDYSAEMLGMDTSVAWFDTLAGIDLLDRVYYRSLLKKGYKLTDTPRVAINTIHASKGGEADNVLVITDMSRQVFDAYQYDPDEEHRVFYVAITRAKKELHILLPQTNLYYSL